MKILTTFLLSLLLVCEGIMLSEATITFRPATAVFVTGVYVAWTTNPAGNSRVDYGTTTAYGSNVTDATSVTDHHLTISGLTANTTYHYKVTTGSDVSGDYTFTTPPNPTGTVKTVGASGKDYTTVSACATAAQPGWTCLVYTGSYASASPASGSSGGGYVTLQAQEAATIAGVNVAGKNYVAVKGFYSTSSIGTGQGGATATYIIIANNYVSGGGIRNSEYNDNAWWVVQNNILHNASINIFISGTSVLIDGNDLANNGTDCIYDGAFTLSVVRNNACHDYAPTVPGGGAYHVDFYQWDGNNSQSAVIWKYNLFEGNVAQRCIDATGNCHFIIVRDNISGPTNMIVRYNYAQNFGGSGMTIGTAETVYANRFYNNTFAFESRTGQSFYSSYYADYSKAFNNLSYNSEPSSGGPWDTGTGIVNNYNTAYDTTFPTNTSWGSRYTVEATYLTHRNLNPSFTDYPFSSAISSASALKDIGGNLTTVTSGCGTSTLTLADVRWFQPGWAGTQADTLSIGNTVATALVRQVTGVNYSSTTATSSGTVTFAANVSCTNGDKVWLYAKSDGVRVLYGTAPDIGAYEYPTVSGTVPTAPTSLTVE
jgi:hypothetical protein